MSFGGQSFIYFNGLYLPLNTLLLFDNNDIRNEEKSVSDCSHKRALSFRIIGYENHFIVHKSNYHLSIHHKLYNSLLNIWVFLKCFSILLYIMINFVVEVKTFLTQVGNYFNSKQNEFWENNKANLQYFVITRKMIKTCYLLVEIRTAGLILANMYKWWSAFSNYLYLNARRYWQTLVYFKSRNSLIKLDCHL